MHGGCRRWAGQPGKPRLRRSFALPEPGRCVDLPVRSPPRNKLGRPRRRLPECMGGRRRWAGQRGKPRLRRSFALPAPGQAASARSRGYPRNKLGRPRRRLPECMGDDADGQGNPASPGRRSFALPAPGLTASTCSRGHPPEINLAGRVGGCPNAWGMTPMGRATRQAPSQAEPLLALGLAVRFPAGRIIGA
jgi:hypothetical protein